MRSFVRVVAFCSETIDAVDIAPLIQTVSVYALPVVFAITLHEAAHGFVASKLGDPTAAMLGRVTLNPWPHIDLVGTVLMPLLLYITTQGQFLFGYAKPVPVDWRNLRHPKRDMAWVALAGPASNWLQALAWALVLNALVFFKVDEAFWLDMCQAGVLVNAVMFAFNLFPLPPLDGGRILVGLLPWRAAMTVSRIEPYGFYVVLALVMLGVVSEWWLKPLMSLTIQSLQWVLRPLIGSFH